MNMTDLIGNEAKRNEAFPVTKERIFLGHAGVCPLPRVAVDAIAAFCERSAVAGQEHPEAWQMVNDTRQAAAELLGCTAQEIALIGPTTVGLNLVAAGLDWQPGDEVIYYPDDYPANVYPWSSLTRHGVKPVALAPEQPGVITWDLVEQALTPNTKLVALASCNFLSGYRIDLDTIGRSLHERGILFCVDGIQTTGAFPTGVEHVDFLSADSHKWLLGPAAAGIFYVRRELHETLRPALLGSWNVVSPEFVAQPAIDYYEGARRYECGMLNLPGNAGMLASMRMLIGIGIEQVAARILDLRRAFLEQVRPLGYGLYLEELDTRPEASNAERSGIITLIHPERDMAAVAKLLGDEGVTVSLRHNRPGQAFLRFSPHFYNTHEELSRVADLMR